MPRLRAYVSPLACLLSLVILDASATPASAQSPLVEKAQGKPTTASSIETSGYATRSGNDNSKSTRWASSSSDGQWWQVDLGAVTSVSQVKVDWESAYASRYRILTSNDNLNWSTAAEETAARGGERITTFTERKARYLRLAAVTRGTRYGVSFYEAKVLGTGAAVGTPTASDPSVTPTPTPPISNPSKLSALLPLAPGNPFTTPLPTAGVPLHSSAEQETFRRELRSLIDKGTRVEQSQYSAALYIVYKNGDVYDTSGRRKATNVPFVKPTGHIPEFNNGPDGRGWPVAAWMQPDPGERHWAIYNPETGMYGEGIGVQVNNGSWSYGYGAFSPNIRTSKGMAPASNPWWGATASGANLGAFTITEHEIRAAVAKYLAGDYENAYIPHVVGYEAYRHHPNQWHYPASKTDDMGSKVPRWGEGGDPNRLGNGLGTLRMGGIFRLSPSIDVQTQITGDGTAFGDMMARIIARTYQKHGATMTDQTEAGFALLAEHARTTSGSWDPSSFVYGSSSPWNYGESWIAPMMRQAIDNDWIEFVYTGRNLEVDTGGAAPAGAYRPGG